MVQPHQDPMSVNAPSPFGHTPNERESTADRRQRRKVWKAYHEEQALLEVERQHRRPVFVDDSLWGDLLGRKLTEFIARERENPKVFVKGGAADRDNPRCLLPERTEEDTHGLPEWAVPPPPQPLYFSREGAEFTKQPLGAGGDFSTVFERRYRGRLFGRLKEAGGRAGARARLRQDNEALDNDSDSVRTKQLRKPPSLPWSPDGVHGTRADRSGTSWPLEGRRDGSQSKPGVIGPAAHGFCYDLVDNDEMRKMEAGEGVEAFFASHVGNRFVSIQGGVDEEAKQLRGLAELERREKAASFTGDSYVNASVQRKSDPALVKRFEEFFLKTTIAAEALPGIERALENARRQKPFSTSPAGHLPAPFGMGMAAPVRHSYSPAHVVEAESGMRGQADYMDTNSLGAGGTSLNLRRRSRLGGADSSDSDVEDSEDDENTVNATIDGYAFGRACNLGDVRVAGSVSSLGSEDVYNEAEKDENDNGVCATSRSTRAVALPRKVTRRVAAAAKAAKAAADAASVVDHDRVPSVEAISTDDLNDSVKLTDSPHNEPTCLSGKGRDGGVIATEMMAGAQASSRSASAVSSTYKAASTSTRRRRSSVFRKSSAIAEIPHDDVLPPPAFVTASQGCVGGNAAKTVTLPEGRACGPSFLPPDVAAALRRVDQEETNSKATDKLQDVAPAMPTTGKMSPGQARLPLTTTNIRTSHGPSAHAHSPRKAGASLNALPVGVSGGLGSVKAEVAAAPKRARRVAQRRATATVDDRGVHKINLGSVKDQMRMDTAARTALLIGACEWGDLEALDRLLELGERSTDVMHAATVACPDHLTPMVEAGLRPRLIKHASLNDQALHKLCQQGERDQARMTSSAFSSVRFLRNDARLRDGGHSDDARGFCLLHHAAAFGNLPKTEFLLEHGADPNARAAIGKETPLMVAARRGQRDHIRVAAALVQAGCNVAAVDFPRTTALHHAADVGRKHMCHYLLLVGASKDARNAEGKRAEDLCRRRHPRAYVAIRSFVGQESPPAAVLEYLDKVEVQGIDADTANAQMALSMVTRNLDKDRNARRESAASTVAKDNRRSANAIAAAEACAAVLGSSGDGNASIASSWDAGSLGGLSGSVISLPSISVSNVSSGGVESESTGGESVGFCSFDSLLRSTDGGIDSYDGGNLSTGRRVRCNQQRKKDFGWDQKEFGKHTAE